MELKKGDIVAVVAEVVAERDGKIIISIPGATVSEDLVIAPRKPIKILDRAPSPGDEVLYKGEMRCIFRRNETQSVVSLVREGMPHDDPSSYLFANIRDIRRVDQSGTVKFVSAEKPVPNSETGREVMERLEIVDDRAQDDSPSEQAPAEKSFEIDAQAFTTPPVPTTSSDGSDDPQPADEAPVEAEPTSVPVEDVVIEDPQDIALGDEADSDSDKITIEMPEGFAPRYPVPAEAPAATPVLTPAVQEQDPPVQTAEPQKTDGETAPATITLEAPTEDKTVSDDVSTTISDQVIPEPAQEESVQEQVPTEPVENEASVSKDEDETPGDDEAEEPAQPEMSEEEREQRELRLQKLRDQTLPQLNGNSDSQGAAPAKSNDIFDDIEDLDD